MRTLTLALVAATAFAGQAVYTAGEGGYHTYRIPALLETKKGTLLAFCEGRKKGAGDAGDIDLMLRRSRDGGKTWTPQVVVHEEGGDAPITIGNPTPVQDRLTGVIVLLFTRNNERFFVTSSADEGETWKPPREITDVLRGLDFAWTRVAAGPGHTIQLRSGRMIAPVWLNERASGGRGTYRSAAIYSDDAGRTWKAGGVVPATLPDFNECMLRERADGAVEVTLRSSSSHFRHTALSRDGGKSWSEPKAIAALVDPVCQASMVTLSGKRVAFANAADPKRRVNMTVKVSEDDGVTWTKALVLHEGPSAYSDMTVAKRGDLLILYEAGEKNYHERIVFERIAAGKLKR